MVKNRENILKTWEETGLYSEQLLSKNECDLYLEESDRLRVERNTSTIPYKHPHANSLLFDNLMRNPRVLELASLIIGYDTNTIDCKLQATQSWMYFKPPGELGRDLHQNIFYSHANKGEIINMAISLEDADETNGCLYYYPGSQKEWCLPINLDDDRLLTNPEGWEHERGKPCVIPQDYVNGELVDIYNKVYCPVRKGTVTFIHSHVLHGSDDNITEDRWRRTFLVSYMKKGVYFNKGSLMRREVINLYE
jgi:ectoine hydroxylase-related dioxygenase (phytanoyl-CoA dioxygenase family)